MSPPRSLAPMLPVLAEAPFDSADHVFELLWAGIRAIAFVDGNRLTLQSASGRDITAWFPEVAPMARQVRGGDGVFDGEIVALGEDGAPNLSLLAGRLATGDTSAPVACVYQVYDLLYRHDLPLLGQPLTFRKQELQRALRLGGPAVISESIERDGIVYFEAATEMRLPGIVAKAKTSTYQPGTRSQAWQEMRVYDRGWFVIGGYTVGLGREGPVGSLLLGEPLAGERLRYVGQAQAATAATTVEGALAPFSAPSCAFVSAPRVPRLVYWLRPQVVCEVKFAGKDSDGRLRFPVLIALRPDLTPESCLDASAERSRRLPAT